MVYGWASVEIGYRPVNGASYKDLVLIYFCSSQAWLSCHSIFHPTRVNASHWLSPIFWPWLCLCCWWLRLFRPHQMQCPSSPPFIPAAFLRYVSISNKFQQWSACMWFLPCRTFSSSQVKRNREAQKSQNWHYWVQRWSFIFHYMISTMMLQVSSAVFSIVFYEQYSFAEYNPSSKSNM